MDSLSSPSSRVGRKRESPQFNRCLCSCVPSPEPRWTNRLHMAVASPTVVAFAIFAVARHPQWHGSWFTRARRNEADGFACATARMIASPSPTRTFTIKLSLIGSPRTSVDHDYAGKQPIPATGLSPARHTSVWAATGKQERMNNQSYESTSVETGCAAPRPGNPNVAKCAALSIPSGCSGRGPDGRAFMDGVLKHVKHIPVTVFRNLKNLDLSGGFGG